LIYFKELGVSRPSRGRGPAGLGKHGSSEELGLSIHNSTNLVLGFLNKTRSDSSEEVKPVEPLTGAPVAPVIPGAPFFPKAPYNLGARLPGRH